MQLLGLRNLILHMSDANEIDPIVSSPIYTLIYLYWDQDISKRRSDTVRFVKFLHNAGELELDAMLRICTLISSTLF